MTIHRSTLAVECLTTSLALALAMPVTVSFSSPLVAQTAGARTISSATECARLVDVHIPDVRITQAVAGPTAGQRSAIRVPSCRVTGAIGRDVDFALVLPDAWNERLVMSGNGGFAGSFGPLTTANNGFATITTNTGHVGSATSARWALGDEQRQAEFGYLAVHETADVGKRLARAYYGADPAFSYFTGCSDGGREGLMEAQRYPDDFDGIIAGAPAYDFTTIAVSYFKNAQAIFPAPTGLDRGVITRENLRLVGSAVLGACDALDGVKDGVVDDPRKCPFKLSSVKPCPGNAPAADCLAAAERAAIERVYAPTVVGGKEIYPGQPVGDEGDPAGWATWITGNGARRMIDSTYPSIQTAFMIEGHKYFLTGDTSWNYLTYDLSRFAKDGQAKSAMLDAVDPNLSRFAAHGGKLIMYHGWADPALNPMATIAYYRDVVAHDSKAPAYARLFMLPGVLHCQGGPGPDLVDWLGALQAWREKSAAPDRLIAAKVDNQGHALRTRPLCPFPQRAAYSGSGSTDDAANFSCRDDR